MVSGIRDVSLTRFRMSAGADKAEMIRVSLPVVLSRALISRGYTHAKINVNEDGILLVPYIGESKQPAVVDLPDWSGSQ